MNQLRLGSLFDGIGAFPYAASIFGAEPIWASEILPAAISVTLRHFPDMTHVGDITKLDGALLPPVDVIAFGSPCQDLSVASGKRAGLAGERSGLFMEAIRVINEMRCATNDKYPRYAIWENVPGCFSSNGRRDYQAVLAAFAETKIPMPESGRWANAGLVRSGRANIAWCVYDACRGFGLAQRRKRVFVVCDFGKGSPEEILLIPKSLCRHPPQSFRERENIAAVVESGVGNASVGINGNTAAALDANYHKGTGICKENYQTLFCAAFCRQRSDAFEESNTASTQTARQSKDATDLCVYNMIGCEDRNDPAVAVDCRNYKEVGDISGTLQAKNKPGYSLKSQNLCD